MGIVNTVCPLSRNFVTSTPLEPHVFHVISHGAKKQVLWIDTARIVAMVQHVRAYRAMSIGNLPGDMRGPVCLALQAKYAIAIPVLGASPMPAPISLGDTHKEILPWIESLILHLPGNIRVTI